MLWRIATKTVFCPFPFVSKLQRRRKSLKAANHTFFLMLGGSRPRANREFSRTPHCSSGIQYKSEASAQRKASPPFYLPPPSLQQWRAGERSAGRPVGPVPGTSRTKIQRDTHSALLNCRSLRKGNASWPEPGFQAGHSKVVSTCSTLPRTEGMFELACVAVKGT